MRVLAIDPGTHCGYAIVDGGLPEIQSAMSGYWDLTPKRHEGAGFRFVRLKNYINEVKPDRVFYEEVQRHIGTYAAQIYGGIVAIIQSYCEENIVPCLGIPVQTAKKHLTGKGNANKSRMIENANRVWPLKNIVDDNEADALAILHCGLSDYPL